MMDEYWWGQITDRPAGQAGYSVLLDGADDEIPSVPGVLRPGHVIKTRVQGIFVGGDPQLPQIVSRGRRQWYIGPNRTPSGFWPQHRYDQSRSANLGGGATPPALVGNSVVNAHPTLFTRAMAGIVIQVGSSKVWRVGGAEVEITAEWQQLLLDVEKNRLYAVLGGGVTVAYALSDITSALSSAPFGVTTSLEPVLIVKETDRRLWIPKNSDTTSWTWKALDSEDLATVLATVTMAWDGWSMASGLPHTSRGTSYPNFLTTEPLYGHEASISPFIQPIVCTAGVIPGDDGELMEQLSTERGDMRSYQDSTPHNYGMIAERSQALCMDLYTPSRVWSFSSWATASQYSGFTPLVNAAERILCHWEKSVFEETSFYHLLAQADVAEYAELWQTPFGVNSDHSVNTSLEGDLQANRTFTFMSYTDAFGTQLPWPTDVPAPTWSYDRTEVDSLVDELMAHIEPTFTGPMTRDVQKTLTHGVVTLDASNGHQLAAAPWTSESDRTYASDLDTGDANYLPHGGTLESPRHMFVGTARVVTFTATSNSTHPLRVQAGGLGDDDLITGYVAIETFHNPNPWPGVDGGSHDTFYQGHTGYGGLPGTDSWTEPGGIWTDATDDEGRWSHFTVSVEYHLWVVTRKKVTLSYADPSYGWDPYNVITDGARAFFAPRHCLPTIRAILQYAYYPPGTTFDFDGVYNFQFHSTPGFVYGGDSTSNFFGAGWYPGPIINGAFHETQIIDHDPDHGALADTTRFSVYSVDHPWNTRAVDRGNLDTCIGRPSIIGGAGGDAIFVFRHDAPFLALTDLATRTGGKHGGEAWVLNEHGDCSPWRYELTIPAYGYWYDGGDPLDPGNWTPVAYDSPGTGYRGRKGDLPSGGAYRNPPPTPDALPPTIPRQDSTEVDSTLLCVDIATCTELWRATFGGLKLAVTPVHLLAGGALYLWLPGSIKKFDPASGDELTHIDLSATAAWTHASMICLNGRLILTGDTGRVDVAA